MRSFRFKDINEYLGTRQLGVIAREKLLSMINDSEERVALDFEGVKVVSNSFADECLAKLLYEMPLEELKKRTTFVSVDDFARQNIAIAFRRRMNAMKMANSLPSADHRFVGLGNGTSNQL